MYHKHFGLEQAPFKITPDPRLFFPGGNRGAVLEALVYAIANGEGIVKVVGEVGSGKTMLCRMLEQELPANVEVVYLANPNLGPNDILHAIAFELNIPTAAEESRLAVVHKLQDFLLEKHAANRRVVAFIEEAQGMPLATLEEIRLLSNLETSQDKLLQIVLFGQPELDEVLAAHAIRQLKERITYSFNLEPFGAEAIQDYINSRLRASGYRGPELFDRAAVKEIYRASAGLLRRVNILGDKALLAAYADNATRVGRKHVRRAAQDSEFSMRHPRWPRLAAAAAVVALTAAGGYLGWSRYALTPEPMADERTGDSAAAVTGGPAAAAAPPVEASAGVPATRGSPAADEAVTETGKAAAVEREIVAVDRKSPQENGISAALQPDPAVAKQPLPGLLTLESFAPERTLLLDIKGLGKLAGAHAGTESGG